jgi:hypothetical protein
VTSYNREWVSQAFYYTLAHGVEAGNEKFGYGVTRSYAIKRPHVKSNRGKELVNALEASGYEWERN